MLSIRDWDDSILSQRLKVIPVVLVAIGWGDRYRERDGLHASSVDSNLLEDLSQRLMSGEISRPNPSDSQICYSWNNINERVQTMGGPVSMQAPMIDSYTWATRGPLIPIQTSFFCHYSFVVYATLYSLSFAKTDKKGEPPISSSSN